MEKQGLLMRGCWRKYWKALEAFKTVKVQRHTMDKQGLLMRGCWRTRWQALETFTIENAKKYYGKTRFTNAGMLTEMLESIENLLQPLEIQRNLKNSVY